MGNFAFSFLISILLFAAALAGLLVFGNVSPPAPLAEVTGPFASIDRSSLPPLLRYTARDGAELSYLCYPGDEQRAVILIHGSAGSAADMHLMALALQSAGHLVVVPDLRGHGGNRPHGDIAHPGQLDEDMEDMIKLLRAEHPRAHWSLVGFSSGGGFALRTAAGPLGGGFERVLLLSPFLRYDAPTVRRAAPAGDNPQSKAPAWTTVAIGRIIALAILNGFRIHALDGLPVLYFAVPQEMEAVTPRYSWRLLQNFQPRDNFRADIRAVKAPMEVLVGSKDELFYPEKFVQVFGAERGDVPVVILPGLGHSAMATDPAAIQAVAGAL